MSRGCHAEGSSGGRSSCEAGLAIVSTESRRCAEVPRRLCSAEAKPGPDVFPSGFQRAARPLARAAHVHPMHCHWREKAPPS